MIDLTAAILLAAMVCFAGVGICTSTRWLAERTRDWHICRQPHHRHYTD